jgi:subfamily B ATP-binding cassette protein MsbA
MMDTPHQSNSFLVRRLLRDYIRPYRARIALAVLCMLVAAAATASQAYLLQPVMDDIFIKKNASMLSVIPTVIVLVVLVNGIASYGQDVLMKYVGQRVIANMQLQLFSHLMACDLATFHDQASGRMISRFTNDIQMMRHSISNVLTGVAKELVTMMFLVALMFYQSWELSLLALVGFPLAIFPITRLGRRMRKIANGTQVELGEFTAQLDESFNGVRVVKAYGRETFELDRARGAIERLFKLYFKAAKVQSAAGPMMETIGGIAIAVVIWYGGYQVIQGETTGGAFLSFIAAILMAYKPLKTVASLNTYLNEGMAAAARYFQVIDQPPIIRDAPNAVPLAVSQGEVQLEQVDFQYGTNTAGVYGINLHVPAGSTVALVGGSGSGKSTLINLILRFYDVNDGRITIDGQDIRDVTLNSLRSQIALVSQEIVLFDDSVRANIAYGRLDATEEEIVEVAKRADAHRFIAQLPNGYNTLIGPHGVKLSGGQRQRLSIARAMLKNAPILLLDEATSSLDSESERSVQQALEALMQQRSTLVIAHRLSTIRHADIIYVLEAGRVVESGTHDALLAAKGRYHQLYQLQFATQE